MRLWLGASWLGDENEAQGNLSQNESVAVKEKNINFSSLRKKRKKNLLEYEFSLKNGNKHLVSKVIANKILKARNVFFD